MASRYTTYKKSRLLEMARHILDVAAKESQEDAEREIVSQLYWCDRAGYDRGYKAARSSAKDVILES